MITLELDTNANAAYVRIADGAVASSRELDPQRVVDYDAAGQVVGIEFLGVSRGVALHDLPHRDELQKLFGDHHIPQFA